MAKLYDLRVMEVSIDEEVKGLDMYGVANFVEYECMMAFDVVDNNYVAFRILHGSIVISDSIIATSDVDELGEYIINRVREAYSVSRLARDKPYDMRVVIYVG